MATFPDHEGFAFSFSHARIIANDKQYTCIASVSVNQELEEEFVFGSSNKPLRRTPGQLQGGAGTLMFSDFEEGNSFLTDLGDKPLLKLWSLDYSVVNEQGTVRSIECISCRLKAFNVDHEQGAGALQIEYPFSFMTMKVNGKELI
jgi:hypothetical protein